MLTTVMIHMNDTPIANRAMMSSGRLDIVASGALLLPKSLQIMNSLRSVVQQLLHLLAHSFKSVVFNKLLGFLLSFLVISCFSVVSVLILFP